MKKLAMILAVMLVVSLNSFASAQPYWPDPCNQGIRNAESSAIQYFGDLNLVRYPCLISYMGYFDEEETWNWWTEEHPYPCGDDPVMSFWEESGLVSASALLPAAAYYDQLSPSIEYHTYNLSYPGDPPNLMPVIAYVFDTAVHSPWGWFIRKSTYENGAEAWRLSFALSKAVLQPSCWWESNIANQNRTQPGASMDDVEWSNPAAWGIVCNFQGTPPNQYVVKRPVTQLSKQISWEDILSLSIKKKVTTTPQPFYEEIPNLVLSKNVDDYIRVVGANFDYSPQFPIWQNLWLKTTCTPDVPAFSCDTYVHETNANITGFVPETGKTYALVVTLKDGTAIQSPDWIVPVTLDLMPVPMDTKKTITNKNGKITTTGSIVPAIQFTERGDGSLLVQYLAPFLEAQPPALQTNAYMPNAWRGTHIRFGLANKPTDQSHDPDDPMILLWPSIPSNVGTVIFPKEFINRLKTSPGFMGTAYLSIQHRDQFGIKRWYSGDGSLTYRFKNRFPVN